MMVRLSTPEEYFGAFPKPVCVYASREFNEVTAPNAECVRHFIGYDERQRPRLGLIAGYRGGQWHAPYSAPFAEVACDGPMQLERIYDFISELTDMLDAPLHITLAPAFYDPDVLPRITGVLGNYATRRWDDYDFYYPLDRYPGYVDSLDHTARKNLRRARQAGYTFDDNTDVARAYRVIEANRRSHGYPLAMSLEQVLRTVSVVPARCMVLSAGGEDVAAALVYTVAEGIAQVIYWGDMPGHAETRPMNLLACEVFGLYHRLGYSVVDVGPSSTAGVPNSGLCRFKESVGCLTALRPSFVF